MKKEKKDDRGGRPPKPAGPAVPMDAAMDVIGHRSPAIAHRGAGDLVHRSPGLMPMVGSQPFDMSPEIAWPSTRIATLAGLVDLAIGFASPPGTKPAWFIEEHRVEGVPRWRASIRVPGARRWKTGWHDDLAGALREVGREEEAQAVARDLHGKGEGG